MFKTLIDELNSRLIEDSKNIKSEISKLNTDFNQFMEKIDNQKKEFQNLPLPEETKNKLIENLNLGLSQKKSELEQKKADFDKQLNDLDEKLKKALKSELDNIILLTGQKLTNLDNKLNDLNKRIYAATEAREIDFNLITTLSTEIKSVFSEKEQIDKLLSNLNDLKKEFDNSSFEDIASKMQKIEKVSLIVDIDTDVTETTPDIPENETSLVKYETGNEDNNYMYDDLLDCLIALDTKIDKLFDSNVEIMFIPANDLARTFNSLDKSVSRSYSLISEENYKELRSKMEKITPKYNQYKALENLYNDIIKRINEAMKSDSIDEFNQVIKIIKLDIDKIENEKIRQYLDSVLNHFKEDYSFSIISDDEDEENLDNNDDKVEIESMISELKNNMSNFSKQKYVDTARQILSKIELLEDEELKNDLTKQLKLVEFGRTNNESNDNSDLEELKEKFRKIYSSKERAMLTDVVIDFDDIENLAAQFEDEFSKNSAYACIDNLKDLYELSGKVSMKIKNDEITPDNEKEITDLLYEIKKISSVVYGGLNEQFEKIKKESEDLEDSKIVSFFKKPSTAATGTKENPQGFIPEGTFDDLEDEFTHPENNSEEEERKIFEELENEINHTSFDKLENLRKEVDSAKISKDKVLKLNMLIGNIKNQLEKIDATSEALKKNIDLISLEKFADKNEIQGMLDNFNKYVDSIKVIYEIVKSNPTDSVIAKEYDKLVDTFVEFNNKVSTKFNIEKFRIKPKSRYCNFKYNDGNVILRLSRERIEEKGYKELFANTEKILNAKNIISELQVKIRLDGFGSLKSKFKMFDKTKDYNKAVNDICEDLIEMLNNEIKELEKDNFTLIPTKAFDSWILMLSIMPDSIGDYTKSDIIELVAKYARMIKNVIEKSNDESLKKQLGKDNIDLDAWYSTIAAISLYKKEHDYFDFKDESAFEDDVTLYADHSSVLHGIKYMDPETKVRNLYK